MAMKKLLIVGLFLLTISVVAGCGSESTSETDTTVNHISTTELNDLLDRDFQYVDIRTAAEYNENHIEEFDLNIDYYQFKDDTSLLSELDQTKPVVLICNSGNRSSQAVAIFESLGFKELYNVKGGVSNYSGTLVN